MTKLNDTAHSANELLRNLQGLVAEAEALIRNSVADSSSEVLGDVRTRFEAAQERLGAIYADGKKKVIAGGKYADTTIRENPYQSMAVAAGVGLIVGGLVGVLVGRRTA